MYYGDHWPHLLGQCSLQDNYCDYDGLSILLKINEESLWYHPYRMILSKTTTPYPRTFKLMTLSKINSD